jgi:hypothetical protein
LDQLGFIALQKNLKCKTTLPIIIQSDSMHPVLKVGQKYSVEYAPYDDLKEFDIVVFLQGEQLMAHFLWHFNSLENRWQTRSIRYPHIPDCPVKKELYLGRINRPTISPFRRILFRLKVFWSRSA